MTVVVAVATAAANILLRIPFIHRDKFNSLGDLAKHCAGSTAFYLGILFYFFAAVLWIIIISKEEVSIAYPMLIGITFITILFGSSFFLNEALSLGKIVGIIFIIIGIAVSSNT